MRTTRGKLFGTDGARGIANADLTPELALAIGRAYGAWLQARKPGVRGREGFAHGDMALVARDTRVSGAMLAAALSAGLASAGIEGLDCGLLPTPGLHALTRARGAAGGVMISASHNPPDFNGIKLVTRGGQKLTPREERELEALVFAEEYLAPRPTGGQVGDIEY